MQHTNRDEAMVYLTQELVERDIVTTAAIDEEIDKIYNSIPEATRAGYGDDKVVAAANFYPTYLETFASANNKPEAQGGALTIQTPAGAPAPRANTKREAYENPVLTDAQKEQVERLVEQTQKLRMRNTPLTSIKKLLINKPKPSTYMKDLKVIPAEVSADKLAEYEAALVQTEENIAAFNKLREAIGKTALPIYLNDNSVKVEGAKISTPKVGEGKSGDEELTLTLEMIAGFLVTRVIGRIPSDPVVGVELSSMKRVTKGGRHTDASNKMGKPHLRWVGRKEALDTPQYYEATTEVSTVGGKTEFKEQRMRTELSFKIITGQNEKGEDKTRTIRFSGKVANVPKLRRKEEYREIFGELSDNKTLSPFLSPEEKQDALQRTFDMIASAAGAELVGGPSAYGEDFNLMVKQINEATRAQSSTAASSFE